MSGPTEPEHTGNLQEAARAAVAKVMVGNPATVLSYDSARQTVSVRIVPCFRRRDPANGGQAACYRPPDLHNIPVGFPGGDAWGITWPLTAGDTGRIVVLDRSADEWKAGGAATTEPQDQRRHDLTDSIFVPDIAAPGVPREASAVSADAMVLRGAELRLGSASASDFVALSSKVDTEIARIWSVLTGWLVAPGDGGLALKAAAIAAEVGVVSTASAKVKSE